MRLFLLNAAFLAGVWTPLLVVELLRSRSKWVERNHPWLCIVTWALAIFLMAGVVLPRFGGYANPDFFRDAW
jgi:hypothetical protein